MATATTQTDATNSVTHGDPQLENICKWVREELGGEVTNIVRQRRWRPVWRVEVRGDGLPDALLFKSDRPWPAHPYPLKYEYDILRVLQNNGILIPKLMGMAAFMIGVFFMLGAPTSPTQSRALSRHVGSWRLTCTAMSSVRAAPQTASAAIASPAASAPIISPCLSAKRSMVCGNSPSGSSGASYLAQRSSGVGYSGCSALSCDAWAPACLLYTSDAADE